MKTMSYNILCAGSPPRRYWTARKELVARMIRDAAPDTPHALPETADLHESGLDGVPHPDAEHKKEQNVVRPTGVDRPQKA